MYGALIVLCGIFGLAVGSFLNVVIYRVPRRESIVSPPSVCPSCGTPIRARDNIPVLSWLLLHGRCRDCGAPISARYPLVELICAGLFAGTAARFGLHWDLPAYLVLFAGLLALSCIDVEQMLLPKKIVYPLTIAVAALLLVAAVATGEWHDFWVAVVCAFGWWIVFFAMNFASPRILGFGDVRLSLGLGLGLGWLGVWYVLLGFFAANVIGAIVGVALIASKRMVRSDRIPYGVFLALGCVVAVFAGPVLLKPFAQPHASDGGASGLGRPRCDLAEHLHPEPLVVPLGIGWEYGRPEWVKMRRAVHMNAATSSRCDMVTPGISASRIRSTPWTFASSSVRRSSTPLADSFDHCSGTSPFSW